MKCWIVSLILVAAVFLCYYPALEFGFVWDDQLYVVQNEAVHDWGRAVEAFTSPRTTWTANAQYNISEWRPLRNISFLIDYSLFGLNPIGYHLHNIALHALAAVLLFFLLRRICRLFGWDTYEEHLYVNGCCGVAALFWAWHPVQTEVVAWVKSRDDLLATPLFFAALLLALPRRAQRRGPGLVGLGFAVFFYVAALLAKENVVVIAAILPLLLFGRALGWFGAQGHGGAEEDRADRTGKLRWAFWTSFVFGLITLAALAVRDVVLGRTAQASYPGNFAETVLTMGSAFARYVRLILWPWPPTVQMADYDGYRIVRSWSDPLGMTGLAILAAVLVIGFAARRRAPLMAIGIGFFLIALVPFSNLVPMMQIMAERFLYLPMAGVAMLIVGVLLEVRDKVARRVVWSILGIFVMGLLVQTQRRLPVWKSEVALFDANRQSNPDSWRPADLYVRALLRDGETTAALTVADKNIRQWPNDPDIIRTGAVTHLLAGDEKGGVRLTEWAVKLQPEDSRASQTLEKWRRMKK